MWPSVFLSAGFMNFYSYQKDVSYSFNDSIINVRPLAFQSIIFFFAPSVITSFGNRCVRAIPNEFVQFGRAAAEHTLILLLLVASILRTYLYTSVHDYLTACRGACM